MKNSEKYNTAKERSEAFRNWCDRTNSTNLGCDGCVLVDSDCCQFAWLELEADVEKPLPCPFCGGEVEAYENGEEGFVECISCKYQSCSCVNKEKAISAHNHVAKAVMESEKEND